MLKSQHVKSIKCLTSSIIIALLTACGGSDSSDPEILTVNDSISDVSGRDGVNSVSIINNDTLDSEQLDLSQVNISVVMADAPLTLNGDGTVNVAPMTAAGTYQLQYKVCLVDDSSICETATVSVEVLAAELALADDFIDNINGGFGNSNIIDVLANDTMNSNVINIDDITLSVLSNDPSLQLDSNYVSVASNTMAGEHQLTYQVCENLNPENCTSSTAIVNVDKGQFMGGIAGIRYESDSANGVTDANGGYIYNAGDNIKFYIGATMLGEQAAAKAKLSPLDLIKDSKVPVSSTEVNSFLDNKYDFDINPKINELVNALTLIYSVDKDKDISNGIVIDEKLHTLWADKQFNLKQSISRFERDTVINIAMYKAFDQELLANTSLTPYFSSLDTFAAQQGLTPHVYGTNQETYYSDPGVADEVYKISVSSDKGTVTWDYFETDDEGNLLPEISYQDKYFYDGNANYTGMEYYEEGVLNSSETYTLNIHGNMMRSDYTSIYGDNSSRWKEYNNIGLETAYYKDNDGDEVSDESEFSQYDENGNEISYLRDNDGDGKNDYKRLTEYANNLKVKQSNYNDISAYAGAENDVDNMTFYYYNEAGLLIRQETDNDADGEIDYLTEWDYNEAGQTIEYRSDNNLADEAFNHRTVTTYENGLRVSNLTDSNGDGVDDRGQFYTYDEHGNRIQYTYYNNGFDKPLYSYFYKYDDANNMIEQKTDNNGDGVADYANIYSFDEHGNMVSYVNYRGEDQDGVYRYGYHYEYLLTDFTTAYLLEN
ncbi:hypothetical protein RI845_08010 [Thalassotalea nanhaiensis]|uniref:RHS repeat protein n=1 Tax=Thalassotalea nanhaiensis TaxID=3065648 RepID=A0ABY9TQP5_9GAMM|nr:hypothetical protein RI845_08010 [Colwelliaceae bacterium SQ345]